MGAGGEGRAPCRCPGRVGQPHPQLHPRNSPMGLITQQGSCTGTRWVAFPGWSPTAGRSHHPQRPCGVGGVADRAGLLSSVRCTSQRVPACMARGRWSQSSTWPTDRAAVGLTGLLLSHLPSAPCSPDFSPGPFRTVETPLGILSLLCQSCRGGEAGPPPHLSQGQIYLFWFKKKGENS